MHMTRHLILAGFASLALSACQVGDPINEGGEATRGDTLTPPDTLGTPWVPPVFSGTSATLVASHDALIWGSTPHGSSPGTHADKNAGKNDRLEVGVYDMKTAMRSLIRFDIPPGISGEDIEHAMLRITSYAWFAKHVRPDSVQINVYRVLESWKEGSGTGFAGQPNSAATNGASGLERYWGTAWSQELMGLNDVDASQVAHAGTARPRNFIGHWDFPLTGLVRSWADDPAANFGVLLAGSIPVHNDLTEDYPQFHSRDAAVSDSLKPLLLIVLKTPSDTTETDTVPVIPPAPNAPANGATDTLFTTSAE